MTDRNHNVIDYVQTAIDGLRQVRTQLIKQLDRVDAALAALGEGVSASKQPRSKKPCCTRSEVVEIIAGLLADNGALTKTEIEDLAEEKIKVDLGKSLSGFAMRLAEALVDPRFMEVAPGQYRLTSEGII